MPSCQIPGRTGRAWLGLAATLVVLLTFGAFAAVGAAQVPPIPPLPPAPEPIDPDARATLDWSVPARYDASWAAWRKGDATYDKDFVTPPVGWSINLDACRSSAVRSIDRYTFVITGITLPTFHQTLDGMACRWRLNHTLPVVGLYRVEVTVHTALGASRTFTGNVSVRDYLIVSIGDSLQSGEGVPDERGQYTFFSGRREIKPVRWNDRRCHRSARSGPALAAQAIEDASPHTSVTFLSFACSGADLKHLYKARYAGAEPGGPLLPPQVDAVAALVGPGATGGGREIDALLVDGGINDLEFSNILRKCGLNNNLRPGHTDCVTGLAASKLVGKPQFAARYDDLTRAVRRKLDLREVYLNGYPAQVFKGGGCGHVGIWAVGINAAEGEAMNTLGISLNHQIERAMRRHRTEGWNLVDDLTTPFAPHAYCSDAPWFNNYEFSRATQGDENGTAHPNRDGHREFARILGRAIVPNQPQTPFRRATLTVDEIKLSKSSSENRETVELTLIRYPNDFEGFTRRIAVPRDGKWTRVSPKVGTFIEPLFREPASPRHAVELRLSLGPLLTIHHGFDDGYGAGAHEKANPNGRIAVRYHVTVTAPGDDRPPTAPTSGG